MTPVEFKTRFETLANELSRIVVGYRTTIDDLLTGLFAGGNILLQAPPGLGKTVIGKALAGALGMRCTRIQFTPDLMPADIVGTNVIIEDAHGKKSQVFERGPVFTNLLLADEINRATPKTQSALLEAMQEHHVTVCGKTYALEEPFLVVATQNPDDLEGTYRLPEAQLDRFLFQLSLTSLSDPEWIEVARRRTGSSTQTVRPVLKAQDVVEMQKAVRSVKVSKETCAFAARLVTLTIPGEKAVPTIQSFVRLGSSPRGMQALILGGKVRALCAGRNEVQLDDLKSVAVPALAHRLLLNFEGQAERIQPAKIVEEVVAAASGGGVVRAA